MSTLASDYVTLMRRCTGVELPVKRVWMLAVVLKSLVQATKTRDSSADLAELFQCEFVRAVSYLSLQGTGFSQHWIVTDLEVRSFSASLSSSTDDEHD